MIQLQVLNRIIDSKDYSLIDKNNITVDYFKGYEKEFKFIQDHWLRYKTIPDRTTIISKFEDFEFIRVEEPNKYLIDRLREEKAYNDTVPTLKKAAELLSDDANKAVNYLMTNLPTPSYSFGGVDIIKNALDRFDAFKDRQDNQDNWYFNSGFEELDKIIHGIQRREEFLVIFARTNIGKSWVLEKMCTSVWEQGYNVGYVSPEMSANSIGYRFDTLFKNFDNSALMWGGELDEDRYREHLENLTKSRAKFLVATPSDFGNSITVSKLRNWVKSEGLNMIAIDGITYMTDERYKRGDNKTTSLTNISEDLMLLSVELRIPVLAVVQANREGATKLELTSIRDSDGIAHNASKILALKQDEDGVLTIAIQKQRAGTVGNEIHYGWNINTGEFLWMPSKDDGLPKDYVEDALDKFKGEYQDLEDVF